VTNYLTEYRREKITTYGKRPRTAKAKSQREAKSCLKAVEKGGAGFKDVRNWEKTIAVLQPRASGVAKNQDL